MTLFFTVLVGLTVGSFLNVVIDRLPAGESLAYPPSRCALCATRLGPLELVPMVSYLWLRGRCRHCGGAIGVRTIVVEVATGAIFAMTVSRWGLGLEAFFQVLTLSVFLVVAVMDLETRRILNVVVAPATLAVFLLYPWGYGGDTDLWIGYLWSALGGLTGFVALLAVYIGAALARSDLGAGDVKLGALVGVSVGFPEVLTALLAAFVAGGAVAIFLMAARGRSRKSAMPFGPFLAAGAMAALLSEGALWRWYLALVS